MVTAADSLIARLESNVSQAILGKPDVIRLAVVALVAEGHLLIEDAPGVGKTSLGKALSKSLDCSFTRLQCTPDMLPSDVTGVSVFNQKTREFEFRPGPIMAQIVLVDEITEDPTAEMQSRAAVPAPGSQEGQRRKEMVV